MNEVVAAMKLIKVYCWEQPFAAAVDSIRQDEIKSIRRTYVLRGINAAFSFIGSRMMIFASFIIFVLSGNRLTPEIVFVVMSLYNAIRTAVLNQFTGAVGVGGECLVAADRVVDLLLLEEKPERALVSGGGPTGSISMKKYCGRWTKSLDKDSLHNIDLEISPGELVVVCGSVGAGKTCLLLALLNEIESMSGQCEINGQLSYAPQESWCFGGSLKQNILVGNSFDRQRYEEVIQVAGLERDLKLFSDGDETFVGEKGHTLSGGQKARVTLARGKKSWCPFVPQS